MSIILCTYTHACVNNTDDSNYCCHNSRVYLWVNFENFPLSATYMRLPYGLGFVLNNFSADKFSKKKKWTILYELIIKMLYSKQIHTYGEKLKWIEQYCVIILYLKAITSDNPFILIDLINWNIMNYPPTIYMKQFLQWKSRK